MNLKEKYNQLEKFNKQAELGGGIERIEKQHADSWPAKNKQLLMRHLNRPDGKSCDILRGKRYFRVIGAKDLKESTGEISPF